MAENESEADVDRKQKFSFHMEEFKALKAEILEDTKIFMANFRYAVVIPSGITGWLLAKNVSICGFWASAGLLFIAILPVSVVVLLFLQNCGIRKRSLRKGDYLERLERKFSDPALGWEKEWRKEPVDVVREYVDPLFSKFSFAKRIRGMTALIPPMGRAEGLSWLLLLMAGVIVVLVAILFVAISAHCPGDLSTPPHR